MKDHLHTIPHIKNILLVYSINKMSLWDKFCAQFPNANLSKFMVVKYPDYSEVVHKESDGTRDLNDEKGNLLQSNYYSDQMKKDLGIAGFPLELTLNPQPNLSIPAVEFSENPHSLGDRLVSHDIYITSDKFSIKFRDIFSNNIIRHTHGKESHSWLN